MLGILFIGAIILVVSIRRIERMIANERYNGAKHAPTKPNPFKEAYFD